MKNPDPLGEPSSPMITPKDVPIPGYMTIFWHNIHNLGVLLHVILTREEFISLEMLVFDGCSPRWYLWRKMNQGRTIWVWWSIIESQKIYRNLLKLKKTGRDMSRWYPLWCVDLFWLQHTATVPVPLTAGPCTHHGSLREPPPHSAVGAVRLDVELLDQPERLRHEQRHPKGQQGGHEGIQGRLLCLEGDFELGRWGTLAEAGPECNLAEIEKYVTLQCRKFFQRHIYRCSTWQLLVSRVFLLALELHITSGVQQEVPRLWWVQEERLWGQDRVLRKGLAEVLRQWTRGLQEGLTGLLGWKNFRAHWDGTWFANTLVFHLA